MERKRKLPARAAARAEQAAKRRTMTPPQRSATPVPAPEPEPTPVEDVPPPLPQSITAGKPLPTVDSPQPDDLSNSEYQSVTESGVLAESLSRSRHKWIMEGIFEKYWSKPTKRKGVLIEEPNNPPKESMTKLGQVTITVEPHVFEATMYAVRDPKAPPPPPSAERPTMQYGPPNGSMPPPATPTANTLAPAGVSTSIPAASQPQTTAPAAADTKPPPQLQTLTPTQTPTPPVAQPAAGQPTPEASRPAPPVATVGPRPGPVASPRGMESVLSPNTAAPVTAQNPVAQSHVPRPTPPPSHSHPTAPAAVPTAGPPRPANTAPNHPPPNGASPAPPAGAAAKAAPGTDPIILMLAEKAGTDPQLRDLMKRVAQGDAAKPELERFQAIIDAITAESKRNGSTTGPSADRLLVDGRTVRYFADEVRAILDIVLSSNPKQSSADLRPPAGSDPLVVMLVKAALDDARTRDIVRRIAENKTSFSDATDLKVILDGLRTKLARDRVLPQTQSPAPGASPALSKPNGTPNNTAAATTTIPANNNTITTPTTPATATAPSATPAQQPAIPTPQQSLRSKGPPPPAPKPDISAIVFEFAGGSGDRFLFPKYSLLEYVSVPAGGQQVVASFLLVRRGSQSEYPEADPEMDYYQPLTVRLFTAGGGGGGHGLGGGGGRNILEHLARVVAPAEEVRRYMDEVMRGMTRGEYLLLAMRLPRGVGGAGEEGVSEEEGGKAGKEGGKQQLLAGGANGGGLGAKEKERDRDKENGVVVGEKGQPHAVLWTTKAVKAEAKELPAAAGKGKGYGRGMDAADEQYQSFIALVSRKEV